MFALVSCGDEPVMSVRAGELVGTWECLEVPDRMRKVLGEGDVLGALILMDSGNYTAKDFPMSDPLRLCDTQGSWELVDSTMTPSGVCSIELDGRFLSIWKRGGKLVLRYPIDVLKNYSAEYVRKK